MPWNQFVNIVLFLVQVASKAHSGRISSDKINRMGCRNEATFKANGTDFMVKESSSKLNVTISASSLSHCARSCIKTSECKSVLYKRMPGTPAEKNCQILNVEKNDLTSDDIQSSTGWIYYEPLQQGTSRCQPDTCQPGYECIETCSANVPGKFSCKAYNACDSGPCGNGATCIKDVETYKCACPSGFLGLNCDIRSISSLTSQSYPSNYPNKHSQTWTLNVPAGRLVLYFYDFKTESCCDKVELRDGSTASSPLIARVSGSTGMYKNYIASGNHMFVKFWSDGSVTKKGFAAYTGSL